MERFLPVLIFVLAVLLGFASLEGGDIDSRNQMIENSSDDSVSDVSGQTVIDCRNKTFACGESSIQERHVSCETWQPWLDYSKLDCEDTGEGLEDVSMITDPANYITIARSELEYDVEVEETANNVKPWDIAFLPEEGKLWTQKGGVLVHDGVEESKEYSIDVINSSEMGLLGVAVDPDFESNRHIYLYYTAEETGRTASFEDNKIYINRISRFRLTDDGLENETVIKEVPGTKYHSGGRLRFGPDQRLYAATGDADNPFKAAYNISYLGGKILRMNTDGSVPADNPFENSTVYSMGHRNPQGIAWNPETGVLYNSEHGPWRHDELNRVEPGENYGWGEYKCDEKTNLPDRTEKLESYESPVRCFSNWTMAPSGMTFVDEPGHPWYGDLFLAGLRGKHIYRAEVEKGRIIEEEIFYTSKDHPGISLRMRTVAFHDGSLYALGDIKGIVEIRPVSRDLSTG